MNEQIAFANKYRPILMVRLVEHRQFGHQISFGRDVDIDIPLDDNGNPLEHLKWVLANFKIDELALAIRANPAVETSSIYIALSLSRSGQGRWLVRYSDDANSHFSARTLQACTEYASAITKLIPAE